MKCCEYDPRLGRRCIDRCSNVVKPDGKIFIRLFNGEEKLWHKNEIKSETKFCSKREPHRGRLTQRTASSYTNGLQFNVAGFVKKMVKIQRLH